MVTHSKVAAEPLCKTAEDLLPLLAAAVEDEPEEDTDDEEDEEEDKLETSIGVEESFIRVKPIYNSIMLKMLLGNLEVRLNFLQSN